MQAPPSLLDWACVISLSFLFVGVSLHPFVGAPGSLRAVSTQGSLLDALIHVALAPAAQWFVMGEVRLGRRAWPVLLVVIFAGWFGSLTRGGEAERFWQWWIPVLMEAAFFLAIFGAFRWVRSLQSKKVRGCSNRIPRMQWNLRDVGVIVLMTAAILAVCDDYFGPVMSFDEFRAIRWTRFVWPAACASYLAGVFLARRRGLYSRIVFCASAMVGGAMVSRWLWQIFMNPPFRGIAYAKYESLVLGSIVTLGLVFGSLYVRWTDSNRLCDLDAPFCKRDVTR